MELKAPVNLTEETLSGLPETMHGKHFAWCAMIWSNGKTTELSQASLKYFSLTLSLSFSFTDSLSLDTLTLPL